MTEKKKTDEEKKCYNLGQLGGEENLRFELFEVLKILGEWYQFVLCDSCNWNLTSNLISFLSSTRKVL